MKEIKRKVESFTNNQSIEWNRTARVFGAIRDEM